MPEFFNVRPPKQALDDLLPHVALVDGVETVATADALGRVTARDIRSPEDLPAFARSAMDGFSVRARDTFGASEGMPALLEVVADIPTGQDSDARIGVGEAAVAYTGGILAHGADSVVMIERTQPADDTSIEVLRPVAPGENVIQVGEDVRAGDRILRAGHRLRAQDIGGLLALGITSVEVRRKPVVAVISTGDELVEPSETPGRGMIRDINTHTIATRIAQLGAEAHVAGIAPDEYEPQLMAARAGLEAADALVFSAGSSLSTRDMTAAVFNALGEPGILVHGISIKPGKPTVIGVAGGKPMFGLPGNPVSALVVFDLIVAPTIRALSGDATVPYTAAVSATLTADIPSEAGREDYVAVSLTQTADGILATPVFGKSNLIYTLVNSDGIVQVPLDAGGLYAGVAVSVQLY